MAADFGRLVFAVPGSPLDPRCHGTNNLLKQGPIVTTGSDDVLEALAPLSEMSAAGGSVIEEPDRDDGGATFVPPDESERASIISSLGPTPVEIGDTIRHTTLLRPQSTWFFWSWILPEEVYTVIPEGLSPLRWRTERGRLPACTSPASTYAISIR
jgi:predicted Rossmann fold nucleotide-binding protein DprA/Smf involved in DNA uptake